MKEYKASKRISVYLSMPSEVQTEGILKVNNNIYYTLNSLSVFSLAKSLQLILEISAGNLQIGQLFDN